MKEYLLTILFKSGFKEEYMCESYTEAFNLEKKIVNKYGEVVDISYIKGVSIDEEEREKNDKMGTMA